MPSDKRSKKRRKKILTLVVINFRAVCLNFFPFCCSCRSRCSCFPFLSLCPMGKRSTTSCDFFYSFAWFFLLFVYISSTHKWNYESNWWEGGRKYERAAAEKKHSLTKIIHRNRYLFVNSSNYCVWCGVCACVIFCSACLFVHFNLVCSQCSCSIFFEHS